MKYKYIPMIINTYIIRDIYNREYPIMNLFLKKLFALSHINIHSKFQFGDILL